MTARKLASIAVGTAAAWLVLLVILDVVLGRHQQRVTAERIGESLQASATIDAVDLALVRGRLDLQRVEVKRDDLVGHLALDIADVRCDLAPLGWALVDRDCRELAVRGTRLEVSTAALFRIAHPKRRPIRAEHVVIDDASLEFSPSAFMPSLGRIAIQIDHAEARATLFRTPLSWIFALDNLRAHVDLPAGIGVRLTYRDGVLSAAGTLFGSTPVELPIELPIAGLAEDAGGEIHLLVKLGEDLAERLVAKRAEDWLKSKLPL